ncbi:class I SAM-dependent methyltransferase [soil metagenome]
MESSSHQAEIISQFTRQAQPFADNQAHSTDQSLSVFRDLGHFTGRERLLDSGCGPGLVSRYLAPHVAEVVGVDLTPAMVSLAAKSVHTAGLSNASFLEGNMTSLPFSAADFGVSVTRYAFHHLENPAAAFTELVRVTRPGGRIIVVDVTPEPAGRSAYDRFERLRDPSHTSALTFDELTTLGRPHGLSHPEIITFGVPMDVAALLDSSFPTEVSREHLMALLAADLDRDDLSFKVRRESETLRLTFPITAAAWSR